jgi:hypothetical protein
MLVVVAGSGDHAAEAFVARHARRGVAMLTPADLSLPGWSFDPARPAEGTAVVAGEPTLVRAIRGVLTRLPAISAADLPHIAAEDRDYAAAEMSAFLLAWLSALRCPVLNQPAPPSLAGPSWWRPRWVHAAVRAGLQPPASSDRDLENDARVLHVLGGRCLSAAEPGLADHVVRLAAVAGVDLLAVGLDPTAATPTFAWADPWPDPSAPELADAVLAYLRGPGC